MNATSTHVLTVLRKDPVPYLPAHHDPGTRAHDHRCSWHGRRCLAPPLISFRDKDGSRQSGCPRALTELTTTGDLTIIATWGGRREPPHRTGSPGGGRP
jgi:hypothetical protein